MRPLLLPLLFLAGCSPSAPPDAPRPGPEAAGPVVTVSAHYPGADAQVADTTLAAPLLQQITGVEGLATLEAESGKDGRCVIVARFRPGTDPAAAVALVQNCVNVAQPNLPEECRRQGVVVTRGDPGRRPTVWVAVTSPDGTRDALFLSNFTAQRVNDLLTRVPGVSGVRARGAQSSSVRVWIDPDKLAARQLTTPDVVAALQKQNVRVADGPVGQPHPGQRIAVTATLDRPADLAQWDAIVVKTAATGQPVYLRDVATAELGTPTDDDFALLNGKPAVVLAVTVDRPVGNDIRKALAATEAFPKGVAVELFTDLANEPPAATPQAVLVELRLPDGASGKRTRDAAGRAVELLRALPGEPACLAFAERGASVATLLVTRPSPDGTTAADIRNALAGVREAAARVTDARRPFPVRLALLDTGDHGSEKLREWADAVAGKLADAGTATDAGVYPGRAVPELVVRIDREKVEKLGVRSQDVVTTLHAHAGSVFVDDFNGFGRSYQVRVSDAGRYRSDDLKKLNVRGQADRVVPLGAFAEVRAVNAVPAVLRVENYPAVRLTANPPPGTTAADAATKCAAAAEALKPPAGYKVVVLGGE